MRVAVFAFLLAVPVFAESAAGLKWTAPPDWKNEGSRPMRAATYDIAPAPGDKTAPECAVYFFGPGQGGSVEANMDRWKNQIMVAGKPAAANIQKKTIHGLQVTTIESAGDYAGMAGGSQPNYRLLGAIVEGPSGNIFIKFTGPAKTVAANQQKFTQLINSFEKQ
jgi:hypothetical protein